LNRKNIIRQNPRSRSVIEEKKPRFCVLGAGHGGHAMAGHLAILGFTVNLYNRGEERIKPIRARGEIEVSGEIEGSGKLEIITTDIKEAIKDAHILMVAVPANGHRFIAESCAPYLRDGQIIVLNPGRTGGALEVSHILRTCKVKARVIIAEAQTFLYASRCTGPAQVKIFRIKNSVPVAALPAYQTVEVVNALKVALPQFVAGDNVFKTSLDNIGAVFHPALAVLNAARIESTLGDFEYYVEGNSPSVSLILEALDRERVAVAAALGIRALTAREWLYLAYDASGRTLYEAMQNNEGYKGIKAPPTLQHRYITEDVPMSLVPIASLGDMLGIPTPTVKTIIHLANILHGCDYWKEGRTVDKLGIAGMSVKDIRIMAVEGK